MRYKFGEIITNPESGDSFLFCGYNGGDDAELWADCSKPDENGERCAIYIEKKTFGGFEGPWTKWCQDLKEFAEQVDHCH